ncbi:MAG: helix-turn-helix domain-containing protein [Desulfobacterales bacterium]
MKLLSVKNVAQRLGVHHSRVRIFIKEGRLPAQKIGGAWVIKENDIKKLKIMPRGRPKRNG